MRKKEPVANMKPLLLLLLAGACLAYTPITERSWVKFKNVQVPTYNSSLLHEAPNIIYTKEILIEERLNQVSKMIDKSLQDFHTHMKRYTTDLTKRMKRATANRDYGFSYVAKKNNPQKLNLLHIKSLIKKNFVNAA